MASTAEEKGTKGRADRSVLAKLGFRSLEAYFKAKRKATFATMSRELGVSGETVRRWYRDWSGMDSCCS